MQLTILPGAPPRFGRAVWSRRLPSRVDCKDAPIDRLVASMLERAWVLPEDEHWLRLCVDEAVVNAMLHGNEGDPQLSVSLRLYDGGAYWHLAVADCGEGFTPEDVPDPEDERSLMLEFGRGIVIMSQWLDTLTYYRGGSCALLSRRKSMPTEIA